MYAAVYDTAVVVGKAMESILMSPEGRKMIHSYGNDINCPLRSMVKEGEGLGQRILHELRKVGKYGMPDVYSVIITVLAEKFLEFSSWSDRFKRFGYSSD